MTTTLDWISSDRHLIAVVASSGHTAPAHPVSHHSVAAATAAPARHRPIVAAYRHRHRHQEMLRRQMVFGWPDTVLPRDAGFGSGVCRGSQKLVRTQDMVLPRDAVLSPLVLSTLPNTEYQRRRRYFANALQHEGDSNTIAVQALGTDRSTRGTKNHELMLSAILHIRPTIARCGD